MSRTASLSAVEARPGEGKADEKRPLISIVTAAYNEERNLSVLYERLRSVLADLNVTWEWIVVDDHSTDGTFDALSRLAKQDDRVRAARFSRNFGSHTALVYGLGAARGDCAIVLAADMQDPPELIPELLAKRDRGCEVVWAVRRNRRNDNVFTALTARLYYLLMRHVFGMKDMPANGADFFLLGRRAIDALCRSHEGNVSILGLITWMGFPQGSIYYDKEPRLHGRSGWSLEKKLKLVADSVTAFSYLPIRMMSLLGILFALGGLALAVFTVVERLAKPDAPAGYATLMIVLLWGFGFVMTFLGVLGEYLWRTFDQVRGRPRYIIERTLNLRPAPDMRTTPPSRNEPVDQPDQVLEFCGTPSNCGD